MNILFIIPSPNSYIEVDEWLTKKTIKRLPANQCNLGILELAGYLRKHFDSINIKVLDIAKNLKQISEKLKLNVEVFQRDIFKEKNLVSGSIIARAFKPLPIILDLVEKKFKNYKNLVVFMGKNGKQMLEDSVKKWKFEYKEKRSLTSKDSFLINIKNIKKNEQD